MELNAIIIEDSHENIDTLTFLLNSSGHSINILQTADNLASAKEVLLKLNDRIDIAFLDIQLKEGVIFDVLEEISQYNSITYEVVFVTAHSSFEYATKAIEFACLDYITKPINSDKLNATIAKAIDRKRKNNSSDVQIKYLLEIMKGNMANPSSISVSLPKGIIEIINLDQINFLKADENTCIFSLKDKSSIHSNKSFAHYIELLQSHSDFIQVSRNCMVNKNAIKRYNHREKTILLKNEKSIIVSHRYAKYFKEEISNPRRSETLLDGMMEGIRKLFGS